MPYDGRDLPFGLYEKLITTSLKARLLRFDPSRTLIRTERLDPAEAPAILGRHIEEIVARGLKCLPAEDRVATQAELTNELLRLLVGSQPACADAGDLVEVPAEQLISIQPTAGLPTTDLELVAPLVPLSDSDLLVNARGEPGLAHALAREVPSANSIDLLCAFVRWHGLRLLEKQLAEHCAAGRPLRVITTVFTGSTERRALDWLVGIGARVKVSYDTQSTRLHAKAWMFRRDTGYSTAYIGSSNLSKAALVDGVEWNVRLSQAGSPEILEKFDATFDTYWESAEYEIYEPERDGERFDRAVAPEQGEGPEVPLFFLDVEPWPHQREMLEQLAVERERHQRFKNLVVAATGTGKTIVAALDYKRLREQHGELSLLFVAHRQEILTQSVHAFRQVLREGAFGELYVDGHRPDEWRQVFASVQSLAQINLERLDPSAFDMVIVDEFHHAAAPTYRKLLEHLRPRILLGLTATPERTDADDILHYFDGHIAVELRLWDALEKGLLCPFQYFGLHDNTDLSTVTWSRKGYDAVELAGLYTADDARVKLVLEQVRQKHRNLREMKALGFCVSIAHAEFMARRFTEAGLPSLAISAETESVVRHEALASLRAGRARALFAVDLFNEGVDLPEVDTILFLRPTESALIFLQQLGRGLRRHKAKDCVTVLDFIGKANRSFRFDLRYRSITGATRTELEKQIQLGFPLLPAGSSMQLDRVATEIVLENLRTAIPSRRPAMVRELRALAEARAGQEDGAIRLATFLKESGLDLPDVYKSGCWSGLRREAGLAVDPAGPEEERLGRALGRLLHLDDPLRLDGYRRWLRGGAAVDPRLITGLMYTLWTENAPATLEEAAQRLGGHPAIISEMMELFALLEERAGHLTYPLVAESGASELKLARTPLSVHARHSQVEIFAAIGRITPGNPYRHREGVYHDEATDTDLFFITLEKSEREYSPSTLYKDYAISPKLVHWESQSTTSQGSVTGQRYIHHRQNGSSILLFVRQRRLAEWGTAPYTLLGLAEYVSHSGERPIQFVWRLNRAMPADFFRAAKVATA